MILRNNKTLQNSSPLTVLKGDKIKIFYTEGEKWPPIVECGMLGPHFSLHYYLTHSLT